LVSNMTGTSLLKRSKQSPLATAESAVSLKDLGLVGKWAAAWALAMALPSRAWDGTSRRAVALATRVGIAELTQAESTLRRFLTGQPVDLPIAELVSRFKAHPRTDQLAVMRCYTPWGWRPTTEVAGLEHVEKARARGQGCLIWVMPTVFGNVLGKRSLAQAGLALHHLSREGHGATSGSRFGQKVLTLPRTRLEDRWLAERIRIPNQGAPRVAMRRIIELLRAGEVVTVTVGANAIRTHRAPFLAASIEVSLGVSELARQGRAALLPALTVRTGPDHFRTTVERPLDLPANLDQEEAGRRAVEELARRMEPHARAWPDQMAWDLDLFTGRGHHV
jgi:lauroyl/myristoyl acyltransferase